VSTAGHTEDIEDETVLPTERAVLDAANALEDEVAVADIAAGYTLDVELSVP
jgi:hypothetical protein